MKLFKEVLLAVTLVAALGSAAYADPGEEVCIGLDTGDEFTAAVSVFFAPGLDLGAIVIGDLEGGGEPFGTYYYFPGLDLTIFSGSSVEAGEIVIISGSINADNIASGGFFVSVGSPNDGYYRFLPELVSCELIPDDPPR